MIGVANSRRSLQLPTNRPGSRSASRLCAELWLILLVPFCLLASDASGEGSSWLIAEDEFTQYYSLGELGEITVNHISLSFVDQHSTRKLFNPSESRSGRSDKGQEDCPLESYLAVTPDVRGVPGWALSDLGDCSPEKSSLDGLVPRISIRGTFFSIGYGVELDKESRGLFVDYGAFTLGIGDSPSGAALFSGASFGLPRWFPGSALLPPRIREDIQFDVGIMLTLDSLDIRDWRPQFGVGVELLEW